MSETVAIVFVCRWTPDHDGPIFVVVLPEHFHCCCLHCESAIFRVGVDCYLQGQVDCISYSIQVICVNPCLYLNVMTCCTELIAIFGNLTSGVKFFSLISTPFKNAKVHKSYLYAVFDKDFEPVSLQNHDTCETDEKCFALFIQIWQHCDCVNVKASDAEREDLRYHCEICEPRPVEKVRVWSLGGFTEYSNRQRTTPTAAWLLGGFTEYSNRQRTTHCCLVAGWFHTVFKQAAYHPHCCLVAGWVGLSKCSGKVPSLFLLSSRERP